METAVEWYNIRVIELMSQREQGNIDVLEFRNRLDLLFEQAKEMEKEQNKLQPIPLTEEWLLKFGFEKVITDTEDAYGIDYNLEVADICYISYSDDFSCAIYGSEYASKNSIGAVPNWNSIKYVHGLQNLYFALTGEELTIGGQDEK